MLNLRLFDAYLTFDYVLNYMYSVSLLDFFLITILSSILAAIFHGSIKNKKTQENYKKDGTVVIKDVSFKTRLILFFITIMVITIPLFKLLGTGYFL